MSKNQFKDPKKASSEKKSKPKAKKTGKGKLGGFDLEKNLASVKKLIADERLHKITGLTLILFSAYMLIAFTSFFFTWEVDQDLLEHLGEKDVQVENWLGKLGAIISHQFIHRGFGIASFVFVLISFIAGFRILFKISLLPIRQVLKYSLFSLMWVSAMFGVFFGTPYRFLGGSVGYSLNEWLTSSLGKVGAGFLVLFALMVFLVLNFNLSFDWFKGILTLKADPEEEEEEEATAVDEEGWTDTSDIEPIKEEAPSIVPPVVPVSETPAPAEPPTPEPSPEPVMESGSIEFEDAKPPEVKKAPEGDLTLDVETPVPQETVLTEKEVEKKVQDFGEYDPTLELGRYQFPPLDLLVDHGGGKVSVDRDELEANKNRIVETLANYNIKIAKIKATIGPTVTLYEIIPAAGVRISKIKNLEDDIALSLSALGIRIIAPIPGKGTIGIEVPNQKPEIVSMRTVIASDKFQDTDMALPVALGKTISNETLVTDLAKMPHLLMAGATGQGKSVGLNAILASLLYKKHPSQVKFVLVDPKKVELTLFNKIERHFLAKLPDTEDAIITDTKKVVNTVNSLCIEMDQRYELLKTAQVRNIKEYNAKFIARKLNPENGHKFLPYIVLVVDEFADLIMTAGKEVETPIARLAQLARAIGIHLIIATQRPSVNIITGVIKANFPSRIAFRVTSKIDSRTILDAGGAEQLIGRGDMLLSTGSDLIRIQCAFVDTPEVEEITEFIGNQQGYSDAFLLPEYVDESAGSVDLDDTDRDALFADAAAIVVTHQQGSASLLQRKLKLGYNRAGRIIDQLEAAGIIGPFEGSKARQVLIPDQLSLEQLLNNDSES